MDERRRYYWILAADETGKPYLIYGGLTESEAREKGLEMLSGLDFEIRELHTRNMSRASAELRGKRLEDTHSLRTASQRLGHNRSLGRYMRRRFSHGD